MSDNDPFAEPDDTDKTVIRPNPGGRRGGGGAMSAPSQAVAQAPADPLDPPEPSVSAYGVPQSNAPRPAASRGSSDPEPGGRAVRRRPRWR